jgi:hypothetical protein
MGPWSWATIMVVVGPVDPRHTFRPMLLPRIEHNRSSASTAALSKKRPPARAFFVGTRGIAAGIFRVVRFVAVCLRRLVRSLQMGMRPMLRGKAGLCLDRPILRLFDSFLTHHLKVDWYIKGKKKQGYVNE